MSDLVKLEEQLLAHDLERAHLPGLFVLSQEHLSISTLPNLGQHLEITLPQSRTALPQRDALTAGETGPGGPVFFGIEVLVRLLPFLSATATGVDVGDEVVVVVVEICINS